MRFARPSRTRSADVSTANLAETLSKALFLTHALKPFDFALGLVAAINAEQQHDR